MKQMDCEFKVRHRAVPADQPVHYRCTMFVRERGAATWVNAGHLVIRYEEWASFCAAMIAAGIALEESET